jgi:polyisoprenoid-binding protein YceI
MRRAGLRRATALATLALAGSLTTARTDHVATAWVTDPAHSRLGFTATLGGGDFDGQFRRFRATIAFDAADLPGSRFEVVIETASADTSEPTRDAALVGTDFFATDRWPTAAYTADRFSADGSGGYVAHGTLTLRGVARRVPVTFSFRPAPDGRKAVLAGSATIRRLDFGVGQGEWRDTGVLGNDVRIHFELQLAREPNARP